MASNSLPDNLMSWNDSDVEILAELFASNGRLSPGVVKQLCLENDLNAGQLQKRLIAVAQSLAMADISNFRVGAVAMGKQHDKLGFPAMYLGTNIELPTSGMQYTIHAEQCVSAVAFAHADRISSLALNVTPCGMCRQFLHEFSDGNDIPVSIAEQANKSLKQLLPNGFGPEDLAVDSYQSAQESELFKATSQSAMLHSARSFAYAPYSNEPTSCIVQVEGGTTCPGFTIESAAFNPGLNALQVAICLARFSDAHFTLNRLKAIVVYTESNTTAAECRQIEYLWQSFAKDTPVTYTVV